MSRQVVGVFALYALTVGLASYGLAQLFGTWAQLVAMPFIVIGGVWLGSKMASAR